MKNKAEWRRAWRQSRGRFRSGWYRPDSGAAYPAAGSIGDVTFEIEFLDRGVEVFSFTFG